MKLDSPKQTIHKSQQEVFDFLNDVKNFEKLMPENMTKFETLGDDGFVFALAGMPEVALKKKDVVSPNKIQLGAPSGGKIDFNLLADIKEITVDSSEVQFVFSGEFNMMIGMMIKGPINKMIETWVTNIPKAI
jgi:carbon monoxide dehydrogenase subunit G